MEGPSGVQFWGAEIFISLVSFGFKAGIFGLASGGRGSQVLPWGCFVWNKWAAVLPSHLPLLPVSPVTVTRTQRPSLSLTRKWWDHTVSWALTSCLLVP